MDKNFRLTRLDFLLEIITRLLLIIIFLLSENIEPFIRKIHKDEIWLYKNPRTTSYVSTFNLFSLAFFLPTLVMLVHLMVKRRPAEFIQGMLAFTLTFCLNGVVTNLIKLSVGRPRPDFFYRCFPEGHVDIDLNADDIGAVCTGEPDTIKDGRKSFPSGHSSFAFCSLGFLSLWVFGQLRVFGQGRGHGWKLVLGLTPLLVAQLIAISRTSDYHHHWQDVSVGSALGMLISYVCYRQYYPQLSSPYSHVPYRLIPAQHSLFDSRPLAEQIKQM